MKHLSRLLTICAFLAGTHTSRAFLPDFQIREGASYTLDVDYDGSRARTSALRFGAEAQWGDDNLWLSLALDTYSDLNSQWDWKEDLYGGLEAGWALHRDNDTRWYVNLTLTVEGPSVLSEKGIDLTPELNTAYGITEDWWIGGALGGVLATAPEEGNRVGYAYTTLWVTWLTGWLPDGSDSLSLNVWAATNEIPDDDKALFISLEYEFDIGDSWDATLGLGTDPVSPWDHLGIYATAGLRYRF